MKPILTAFLLASVPAAHAANTFNLAVNYTGDVAYRSIFESAEAIWESIIPSYLDGSRAGGAFTGITISASIVALDGPGNILGQAGPSAFGTDRSNYKLVTTGLMQFDTADFSTLTPTVQLTVILHEMGHVLGLGTMWENNALYVADSGRYTGANGLAAYRQEYNQPLATFVPVELGGGPGTKNGHWDEVEGGGGLTGRVSQYNGIFPGNDMQYELMSGWLNADQPYYISELTRGSLRDLGYDVTYRGAVPEATTTFFTLVAASLFAGRRRRVR